MMGDDFNKTWDSIPTLNLEMDDDYETRLKSKESRRHDRADFFSLKHLLDRKESIPIRIGTAKKGAFNGIIINLSSSGLRVSIPVQLDKDERIKVGFVINKRTIMANAVARWAKFETGSYITGIEFQGIPVKDREFLDNLSNASLLRKVGWVK